MTSYLTPVGAPVVVDANTASTRMALPPTSHLMISAPGLVGAFLKFGGAQVTAAAGTAGVVATSTLTLASGGFLDIVYASKVLTGTDLPTNGQTVSIGGIVYTFQTSLTTAVSPAVNVLIGAGEEDTYDNLAYAINGTAGHPTLYSAPGGANAYATASSDGAGAVTVTAITGVAATGNAIVIAENCSFATWAGGATALSGGLNAETVTIGSKTYTFKTTLTGAANEVLIGADPTASFANLKKAINDSGTRGTHYGLGTSVNAYVQANAVDATTLAATALVAGTAGNSIATTETCATASWTSTVMASGATGVQTSFFLSPYTNLIIKNPFYGNSGTYPETGGYIAGIKFGTASLVSVQGMSES